MKRIVCVLLCMVLCIGLFCGCGKQQEETKGEYSQTLSDELRREIAAYFGPHGSYNDTHIGGYRYAGTYNGYVALMGFGGANVPTTITIGDNVFKFSSVMSLVAYKDWQMYTLEEVYGEGKLTDDDIAQIYENYVICLTEMREQRAQH